MKPFLKWVGGKTQILDKIIEQIPKTIENYHEPFIGGGSVLLAILSSDIKITGKVFASDANSHLISLYEKVRDDPDGLIAELEELSKNVSEEVYYANRVKFNSNPTPAMFLCLNKTGFRGLYREGPNGYNVPWGHMNNPTIFTADHIRSVSRLVKNVILKCQSFEQSLLKVNSASNFVYLDPPYAPENATSFVSYTRSGFSKNQHETLFQMTKNLPCKFLLSNSDVSLVRDAFPSPQFLTEIVLARRAINSKDPSAQTNEVLIQSSR